MLTAEQKIRLRLTGSPDGVVSFQHEGAHVKRLLTGGTLPSIYATFHHRGDTIHVQCASCDVELGRFDAHYGPETYRQLLDIRVGELHNRHHCTTNL